MFRPTKFKVITPNATGAEARPAVAVQLNQLGATHATYLDDDGEKVTVPLVAGLGTAFLIEFVENFDRHGAELYLGDVLDIEREDGGTERGKIYWDASSCCYAVRIGRDDGLLPLTNTTARKMTRVGNAFETPAIDTDGPTPEEIADLRAQFEANMGNPND